MFLSSVNDSPGNHSEHLLRVWVALPERKKTPRQNVSNLAIEVETMQTSHKFHTANFIRFFYDGSILFLYVLALVITVAFGAYGLELLFSTL